MKFKELVYFFLVSKILSNLASVVNKVKLIGVTPDTSLARQVLFYVAGKVFNNLQ